MAQNVYDRPDFFAGYSQLPRQVLGLDGAAEWPSVRAMLPDVGGLRVVDLGCGFGWAARWMRDHGAQSVMAIDLSERMIERARAETRDDAIEYRVADLESLELPESVFDLAYSSLAFHYVRDFGRLIAEIGRGLVPGGHLVFSIEHPIFMAATHPHWLRDEDDRLTWPVNRYALEGERRTHWIAENVLKYHRRVSTTLNTLVENGFAIRRLGEFAPTAEQIAAHPGLAEEIERPMMLLVAATCG